MKSVSKYIFRTLFGILILSQALVVGSCRDEMLDSPVVEPGLKTFISLSVSLPEAQQYTRADMNPDIENRVNNLSISVFSASSGKRLYYEYRDNTTHPKDFPVDVIPNHTLEKWGTVEAETGRCYIVAIANSKEQPAIDVRTHESGIMKDLVENAETWTDFRAIAVEHLPGNIYVPRPAKDVGLYMSGCYYESPTNDPPNNNWDGLGAINIKEVGTEKHPVELPGTVHLRRPYSQIKFEIVPDYNNIELTVNDYQVFNVPQYSWVYERAQQDASSENILGYANAGDAMNPDFASNNSYPETLKFSSANMSLEQIVPDNDTGNAYNKYSFDFWMAENKRTGLESCTQYTDREREFTSEISGAPQNIQNVPTLTNTGIYKSLCSSPSGDLNNNATFVKINCTVVIKNPDTGIAVRTAETSYFVHLGYINNVASDFNSFRNAKYTYKIKVKDVENIVVEASREGDNQPSAEGMVTDAESQGYNLDAHFNVFNISISEEDIENYNFLMESYYNNERHIIETGANVPLKGSPEWKFYDWVQLVKIDDTVRDKEQLDALALENYPGKDSSKILHLNDITTPGSYTVFVNEYVYEDSDVETTENWKKYVDQPSRRFWIRVTEKTSHDGESIHCRSKYYATQRSIQTYYNPLTAGTAAIGIEHINETFGMNLDWTSANDRWDNVNGRYNLTKAISTGSAWTDCIIPTEQQFVNEITNSNQQYYNSHAARYFAVPKTVSKTSVSNTIYANDYSYYPQISGSDRQYINAATACMNRNRDENGDGKIDLAEMKWILPTSEQMLRIIIGEKNLTTPLINYNKTRLPFSCSKGQNAIYHFATSNNRMIWAEEGVSSSQFGGNLHVDWNKAPWEVRCIRYLGTDLTQLPEANKAAVSPAYSSETLNSENGYTYKSGVVKVPYYYGAALRDNSYDPLPVHKIIHDDNKLGRYGFEVAPKANTFVRDNSSTNPDETTFNPGSFDSYDAYINNPAPCDKLTTETGRSGWRIPNQREVAIMMTLGILQTFNNGGYNNYYLSCTQEYWANTNTPTASLTPGADFRIVTVQLVNSTGTAVGDSYTSNYAVRCVRDLTAAEANMTYNEIRSYKTRAIKSKRASSKARRAAAYKAADAAIF